MLKRMFHWVTKALVTASVVLPVQSWALGLGELDVNSALNERFAGTIEMLDAEGYQSAEIMVSMASREDFERVGVERFFYLTNLAFEVEIGPAGRLVKVTSTQPVTEPYLNFIVEVLWPRGRLLKEFTVLLDPPTFSKVAAPAITAPSQSVARVRSAPQDPAPSPSADPATRVNLSPGRRDVPADKGVDTADGLMTTRDDTLWAIAKRTLPSERVSINQQMLAIQRKNPQAFIRNNINLLKAGYVLDLPSENEALNLAIGEAAADVAAQTEDWRSGTSNRQLASAEAPQTESPAPGTIEETPELRAQVDATQSGGAASGADADTQGQVRIIANRGELAAGSGSGDDPSVNQLIEEKETLVRQVDELTYQLDREKEIAQNEVAVKERQLEVKNAEIAQMQQQMREMRELLNEAAQNQDQSPKPVQDASSWWMSPMVLFGVIGVLVLILAFALVALRRGRVVQAGEYAALTDYPSGGASLGLSETQQVGSDFEALHVEEKQTPTSDEDQADTAVSIGSKEANPAYDNPLSGEDDLLQNSDVLENSENDSQVQTGDVIGEAEIYIAYGRYGQAANLLGGVLEDEPDRWDVRLKMLEVCLESHDQENFAVHAQFIQDECNDESVLQACQELQTQFDKNHVDLSTADAAEESLAEDSETIAGTSSNGLETGADDVVETDASQDNLNLEVSTEEDSAIDLLDIDDEAESESDSNALDAGLDFELEFDSELGLKEEASESTPVNELGGDLGLDFDPDRDVDAPAEQDEALTDDTELKSMDEAEEEAVMEDLDDLLAEMDELAVDSSDVEDDESVDEALLLDIEDTPIEDVSADESDTETTDSVPEVDNDDFDFDAAGEADINETKLDLAEAYVDMGDADGAQDILAEVLEEGTPEQQQKAREMLDSLAG